MYSFQDHLIRDVTLTELSYSYHWCNGLVIFLINTFMHCIIFNLVNTVVQYHCRVLFTSSLRCSHIASWNKFMNLSPRTCDFKYISPGLVTSKGIIYSSSTIYLLSLKLLKQSILELTIAQGGKYYPDLTWQ